jgi:hypothetical protein
MKIEEQARKKSLLNNITTPLLPERAIMFCLERAGLTIDKIDKIAFYGKPFTYFGNTLKSLSASRIKNLFKIMKTSGLWLSQGLWPERPFKKTAFKGEFFYIPEPLALASLLDDNSTFLYLGSNTAGSALCMGEKKDKQASITSRLDWPCSLEAAVYAILDIYNLKTKPMEYIKFLLEGLSDSGIPCNENCKDHVEKADKLIDTLLSLHQFPKDSGLFFLSDNHFQLVNSRLCLKEKYKDQIKSIQTSALIKSLASKITGLCSSIVANCSPNPGTNPGTDSGTDPDANPEPEKVNIICSPVTAFLINNSPWSQKSRFILRPWLDTMTQSLSAALGTDQTAPTFRDKKILETDMPSEEEFRLICEKNNTPFTILAPEEKAGLFDDPVMNRLTNSSKGMAIIQNFSLESFPASITGLKIFGNDNNEADNFTGKSKSFILSGMDLTGFPSLPENYTLKPFILEHSPFPEIILDNFFKDTGLNTLLYKSTLVQKEIIKPDPKEKNHEK